ncbi:uncharacterized protein CLUP02_07725 [Colletotrichum lupini]|uniref:Uncharacterized protein n=3 Tax=Colletotrichum acutatum species complex TaxID=2707335 RepID=A0A9Q8WFY4_9PEZI|nr:uncharacterized protein CLUP02_07725 [Colletotrichum lupini]XP_060320221.1 uncharacterized protein CCOS01_00586 [Colletotrichum costaricense]XP_060384034.1 uncharacterized protein CTAM01_05198 [Colletotrichum tamarilloi]KAI3550132.1 hypothetical protein CSPX01_01730 [Colletotrichum filicis]KAK1502385.1 hypothetical protein CTAM01_05198 [Colletotrichum tamarilloi]KAK1539272.1 hypothetical protein CCOS01_00586 [Colletotrichum costaricense]UQC82238.1 hypothetical protein CLUP02_07725 [Colleto
MCSCPDAVADGHDLLPGTLRTASHGGSGVVSTMQRLLASTSHPARRASVAKSCFATPLLRRRLTDVPLPPCLTILRLTAFFTSCSLQMYSSVTGSVSADYANDLVLAGAIALAACC